MVKIHGKSDLLQTGELEIIPGVILTLNGLPHGYQDMMEEDIPSPVPPIKKKYDADGKVVLKHKGSKEAVTEPDEKDPAYLAKSRKVTRVQAAWMLYHGTLKDKNLIWEAKREDFGSPRAFYEAIHAEMIAANFGPGHVDQIALKVMSLSGLKKEQLERIRDKVFLAPEGESEN